MRDGYTLQMNEDGFKVITEGGGGEWADLARGPVCELRALLMHALECESGGDYACCVYAEYAAVEAFGCGCGWAYRIVDEKGEPVSLITSAPYNVKALAPLGEDPVSEFMRTYGQEAEEADGWKGAEPTGKRAQDNEGPDDFRLMTCKFDDGPLCGVVVAIPFYWGELHTQPLFESASVCEFMGRADVPEGPYMFPSQVAAAAAELDTPGARLIAQATRELMEGERPESESPECKSKRELELFEAIRYGAGA